MQRIYSLSKKFQNSGIIKSRYNLKRKQVDTNIKTEVFEDSDHLSGN